MMSQMDARRRGMSNAQQYCAIAAAIVLLSVVLGCSTARNDDLPRTEAYVSNVLGFVYFIAWSLSFYPQVMLNYERKTTVGLSAEFIHLNLAGYIVYSLYNCLFFFDGALQQEYRDAHGGQNILVESHDVMFAVHGLCLTLATMCQLYYYDGRKQLPSRVTQVLFVAMLAIPAVWYARVAPALPLDLVYFMSYEKMFVTVAKYAPQAYINWRRRSTEGWSIGNILLDLTGGIVSTGQEIFDGLATGDLSNVYGNPVKLGLGLVSIVYDLFFVLQVSNALLYACGRPARRTLGGGFVSLRRLVLTAHRAFAVVALAASLSCSTTTGTPTPMPGMKAPPAAPRCSAPVRGRKRQTCEILLSGRRLRAQLTIINVYSVITKQQSSGPVSG